MMIVTIPVCLHELQWSKSCDESCDRSDTDIDDIIVCHRWILPKMDEVCEDIERIREE